MSISPRTEDLRDAGFHFGSTAPTERENTDGLVNGRELWLDFSGDVPVLRWLDDGGTWRAVSDGSGFGAAIPATIETAVARTVVRTAEVAAAATVSGGEVEATIDTALARTVGRTTATAAAAHVGEAVEAVITNAVARTVGRTIATEAAAQIAAVVAATVDTSQARTVARTVATSATATVAAGGFDPLSIDWHAAGWADDPNWTNPGDGNPVSQWDDGSGNSRHATQGTAADRPTFRSSVAALNNRAAVEFVDDHLATSSWTALSQPNTVVMVAQWDAVGGDRGLHDGIASSDRHLMYTPPVGDWFLFAGSNGPSLDSDAAPHLFVAKFSGAQSHLEVDGFRSTSNPNVGGHDLTGLTIGAWWDGTNPFDGHVAFWGVYDGNLPQSDRDDLEAWVADYYSI